MYQSSRQVWLWDRKGDDGGRQQSKASPKRTQSSPKITPQPMLDVTQAASILRVDRRSCSAPGRTYQTETPGAHEDVNAGYQERTYPSQQSPGDEGVAEGEQRKSVKRASSVVLPAEWATMAFPLQHPAFNAGGGMMESPAEQSHLDLSDEESEHDDVPPAVPPKAPARKLVPFLHVSPLKPRKGALPIRLGPPLSLK